MPESIPEVMDELGRRARAAARQLAMSGGDVRNAALHAAAAELRSRSTEIIAANEVDMRAARERGLSSAMLDRLMLDAGSASLSFYCHGRPLALVGACCSSS